VRPVDFCVVSLPPAESQKLEFRGEFFNAFIHPRFANLISLNAAFASCGDERRLLHGGAVHDWCRFRLYRRPALLFRTDSDGHRIENWSLELAEWR
jgi:hypothetical protein